MTYQFLNRRRGSGDEIARGQAGEDLGDRKVVYRNAAGRWMLADADTAATMPTLGFTMGAILNGHFGRILLQGMVGLAGWTWVPGGELYTSPTAGEITQTSPVMPDIIQVIGVAHDANMIYFDPKAVLTGVALGCPILEGSTAFVGFDECKEPYTNYFYCDSTADDVQINAAEAYVVALGGGSIELERGTFTLADPIIPTGNELWFKGQGRDTFLDGDGLATTEHVFHITGRDDIRISDMSMQTQDGGTKTCHCIFIEDGSDRFHIENIIIVDSDDDGIHIEGTNIVEGKIVNNIILDCDGEGIFIDMDGGNTAINLDVRGNTVRSAGANGMLFSDLHDSDIAHNTIDSSTGDGLELLVDCDDNMIKNNMINNNGAYGINIAAATSATNRVKDNKLVGNVTAAILDTGTDTAVHEWNESVETPDANIGRHPVQQMLDNVETTVRLGFTLPLEFQEVVTAQVVVVAAATGNMVWDAFTDFGKLCATEDYNAHNDSVGATTTGVTINDFECIDVSAALDGVAAGDRIGLEFWRDGDNGSDTVGANVYVVELRLRYV